ncbi:uncharacterized protein LOC110442331 [Mizuhopecten yessoensis]|uniref:uncharacterized protein LOC110442331 n=1 Tax=Mizuhopecten yessoensis TaxID=6573 RepID=UPI000B45D4CA|nr:uncharacterized protein LOC110442331 [Mizuhopecten yessoensis]
MNESEKIRNFQGKRFSPRMFCVHGVVLVLLSLVIILNGVDSSGDICQLGWRWYNNHCYLSRHDVTTWTNAQQECQRLGSNLVTIETAHENSWLKGLAGLSDNPWIGANDQSREGDWRWVIDNSKVTFSDWGSGEPNNDLGHEDCAQFYHTNQWNDNICTVYCPFICEKEDKCLSHPCLNGGTCTRSGSNFNCSCTNEYQGINCQLPKIHEKGNLFITKLYINLRFLWHTLRVTCTTCFHLHDTVDACLISPCTNGATCNRVGSDYSCSCTDRYTGSNCTKDCRPGPADIVIVLDSSSSAEIVLNASRSFAASVVERLSIDVDDFRIAILTYSVDVHLEFAFNNHTNKTSLLTAIHNISSGSSASYLHTALRKASDILLSDSQFGVKQYILLLSDGLSTYRQDAVQQSRNLTARGVKVLCVGIGSQVAQEELLEIATDTPYVFSPSNDDVLNVILMETADMDCTDCLINKFSDIVLLVDVSKYQSAQLQRTLDTVRFFIQQVRAYFSDTRIAMVTFDVRQHVKFGLTDDQDTDGILVKSQIGITTYDLESDVKAALAFVRTSVLSGARGTSRKFVVVFSNEGWTDVDGIVRERQALNLDNVTVAFVPVGLSAELDTVYSVADQASDVYYVGNDQEDHDEDRLKALIAQTSHVECVPDLFDKRQ